MITRFVFVTGGVVSSIGKGIVTASLGALLKARGYSISILKLDPYINVDPGTMSPIQHGEVFVTEDGAETDLDLGHYERFTDICTSQLNNVTTGQVYSQVIENERAGKYDGATVQVIPHITDEIKRRITCLAESSNADIILVEVGGTVGDIESFPFLEAIRQYKNEVGKENVLYLHVTLIPWICTAGETKTKPTQHSVKTLRSLGIQPDILVCRSDRPISDDVKEKLSGFCDVPKESIISALDATSIYQVPLLLEKAGLARQAIILLGLEKLTQLGLEKFDTNLIQWTNYVQRIKTTTHRIDIAIVGKYVKLPSAYLSISEALNHAAAELDTNLTIDWVDSEEIEKRCVQMLLERVNGVIVPGGFGTRGIEGKIKAIQYARETRIPFLGICLGMQCAVVEWARNVMKIANATSEEWDSRSPNQVITLSPNQIDQNIMGGTMRLGAYRCLLRDGTQTQWLYQRESTYERHRHRYEFNNKFLRLFNASGYKVSGVSPSENLVEIIEYPAHPFFIGTQFHPEFLSRPNKPHPLFLGLVQACLDFILPNS
jgi:CTP synthase